MAAALRRRRLIVTLLVWLGGLALSLALVARAPVTGDLGAFLPRLPSPLERLAVDEIRDGAASRIMLLRLSGADPETLARISRELARNLRTAPADRHFTYIANGDSSLSQSERDLLFKYRYLLSPKLEAASFTEAALTQQLQTVRDQLDSSFGTVGKKLLLSDPGGEFLALAQSLGGGARPRSEHGAWFDRAGSSALMLAQTRAPGFDANAQIGALAALDQAFEAARKAAGASGARLERSGPGVFSVKARAAIERDAEFASGVAIVAVLLMLWLVFRSWRLALPAMVPAVTGVIGGLAAVALGFGVLHGITLGFGATLIGEAVDYGFYLLGQRAHNEDPDAALRRLWPTLQLGVATSLCGFVAMLASGFPGLQQLGVFSAAGLLLAAAATRWVLPRFISAAAPPPPAPRQLSAALDRVSAQPLLRAAAILVVLAALAAIAGKVWQPSDAGERRALWDHDLANLSPLAPADRELDATLRTELGATDVRLLAVAQGETLDAALAAAERAGAWLDQQHAAGHLAGYDSPARLLPSLATQQWRREQLPAPEDLRHRLDAALAASEFTPGAFDRFLADVAAARNLTPLTRDTFAGTALGLKLEALIKEQNGVWFALLPLSGIRNQPALLRASGQLPAGTALLDLKERSAALVERYRERALVSSALGVALILGLLGWQLRSLRRVGAVVLPLAAALIVTTAAMLLLDGRLTLFHLVALLLVFGIGSNYALFFERPPLDLTERARTQFSVALCCVSTIIPFGLLATSSTPVLGQIGRTVAIGAVLCFMFAALWTNRFAATRQPDHAA